MKKSLIVCTILLFIFSGCSKSGTNGNNNNTSQAAMLTADVDGTQITFATAVATREPTGIHSIGIAALNLSGAISIGIASADTIITGTFIGNYNVPSNNTVTLNYVSGSIGYASSGYSPDTCTVTITSMTKDTVKGIFNGNVKLNTGSSSVTEHIITNGKFTAAFKN